MTGRVSLAHLRVRGRRVVEICMLVPGRAGGVSIPAAGFWLMLPLALALVEPARTTRRTGPHAQAAR